MAKRTTATSSKDLSLALFILCHGNKFLIHNLDQQSRLSVHKLGIRHLGEKKKKKGVASISLPQKLLKAAALLLFKLLGLISAS